ncbi:uncharacterized protein LOC135943640 [Cloeon dipterum]|uniref:uncharacterized protein LOC135943640 n=1 Tax=Cloeon dipterum TaxID=197152 RepID=UPI0032200A24
MLLLSAIREALDKFSTVGIGNMSSAEEIEIAETTDCNWRSGKTLMDQLWFMYEKQLGVDLKIAVASDDKRIKTYQCHKMIVRRLTAAFDLTLNESGDGFLSLDIGNLDPNIFAVILTYAYTDKLDFENMDMKDVIAVHKVASLYQMDAIRQQCNKTFLIKMNKNNVWDLLTFLEEQSDVDLERCLSSFLSMSVTGCLDSPNFLDCGLKVLEFIVGQEELPVAEVNLIESVIRWAKHKEPELTPEKSKDLLGPCLGKLRFLCLTPAEFSEVVAPSGLLPQDDCLSILVNIISGNKAMPLPDHICKLDTPRIKLQDEPLEPNSPTPSSEEQLENPTFPAKVEPSAAPVETYPTSEASSTSEEIDCLLVRRPADPKFQLTMFSLEAPGEIGVNIEVSKSAILTGVRITSQVTPVGCEPGNYQEDMYVSVMAISNGKQSQCAFQSYGLKAQNGQNKYFDVMFKHPCMLQEKKVYLLKVVLRKPGMYMFNKRLKSVSVDGYQVKFSVVGCKKDTNDADPIQAIFLVDFDKALCA